MNPIIVSSIPDKGVIEVFIGTKINGSVGLVDISLPEIMTQSQLISISCDQVDSTCFNRKRLLRSFYCQNLELYTTINFNHVMYYKVDSSDYKLTIRLFDENGPLELSKTVMLTLNLQPDHPKRWINM